MEYTNVQNKNVRMNLEATILNKTAQGIHCYRS